MSREQRARLDAMLRQAAQSQPARPQSVDDMRARFAAPRAAKKLPDGVTTTEVTRGGRPVLLVEPASTRRPGTIVYFHGGGFVLGSPRTALPLTAGLVARTGMRALSVDYRLAPEHPFPAAVEDTTAVYRALLDEGTAPAGIAFAGDSIGGGLTVVTWLAAREAGLPRPAALVAFSPAADASRTGESMISRADADPLLTRDGLETRGAMYLAGQDPLQPLLSPAVLADLSGFPPLLLQVGTNDMLFDDSTRLAARAVAAGADVILDVTAGVPHVFQEHAGQLDEADQALDRAALFLTQHVRG